MEKITERAKRIICEEAEKAGCQVKSVLLFGSQARGEQRPDSDWDFFVIIDRTLPYSERWDLSDRIRERFVQAGFWGDVIVQSEQIVEERKNNTGFLVYYVLKEGIEI